MSITLQQVILKDKTLWLVADPGENEGALCSSPKDFKDGRQSYAHLFPDKSIMRFQTKIGEFDDLKFTGISKEVRPEVDAFDNLSSWGL